MLKIKRKQISSKQTPLYKRIRVEGTFPVVKASDNKNKNKKYGKKRK